MTGINIGTIGFLVIRYLYIKLKYSPFDIDLIRPSQLKD